jgi:hypothetical protein
MNMQETEQEFINQARIDKEMTHHDDCDVFISRRNGKIVFAKVKPVIPEIRMDFQIIIGESPVDNS